MFIRRDPKSPLEHVPREQLQLLVRADVQRRFR